MSTKKQDYVLVTGASAGIGKELARLFAEDGYNLILVSRTQSDLEQAKTEFSKASTGDIRVIARDLFEPSAARELYDEVKAQGLPVSILVNDAGQGVYGKFVESDIEQQLKIIQLNISSLTSLTYYFLRDMVSRNEGKILQVASTVSEVPSPLQSVYGGTKAFVLSFTQALINELKDTNITVTALQPGVTDTDFFNKAGAIGTKLTEDPSKMSDPADVAKDGYKALMSGDDSVVSGLKNKLQSAMSNILPDSVLAEQTRKQSEKSEK